MPLTHTGENTSSNKARKETKKTSVVMVKAVDYSYVHKLYKRFSGNRLHVRCYILVTDMPERGATSLGDSLGTRGIVVRRCPVGQPGGSGYLLRRSVGMCQKHRIYSVILCMVQDTVMSNRGFIGRYF